MLSALLGVGQATFVSKLELIENNTTARCGREQMPALKPTRSTPGNHHDRFAIE